MLSEVSRKFTSEIFPRSLPLIYPVSSTLIMVVHHIGTLSTHTDALNLKLTLLLPPFLISLLLAPHISESTLETVVVQSYSNSRKTSVSNNVMSSNQPVERVRLISNSLSPGLIPDNPRLHRPSQDPLRYFSSQRSSNLRCEGGRVRIWVVSIPERFGRVQILSRM